MSNGLSKGTPGSITYSDEKVPDPFLSTYFPGHSNFCRRVGVTAHTEESYVSPKAAVDTMSYLTYNG